MTIPESALNKGLTWLLRQPLSIVITICIGVFFGWIIWKDRISPKQQIEALQARSDKLEKKNADLLLARDNELIRMAREILENQKIILDNQNQMMRYGNNNSHTGR